MNTFHYVAYAQEVIFGSGALSQLGEATDRLGSQRLLLCTSHSLQVGGQVEAAKTVLGQRLVGVFDRVQPHVQDVQVDEVLALADENEVDGVIGLGGGSPLGMAKAIAFALEERRSGHTPRVASPTAQPRVPVVAIPTTYAGSEMTAVYGVTHARETPPRKVTVSDPKIAPKVVLYDPALTLDLPPALTAATGMNALAHCIEALYSRTRHPLSSAAALGGVQYIGGALMRCYTQGRNLEARTDMLIGAHLAARSLADVAMGLHHGLCHVLGGTAHVPHGVANAIILPHAMRFNAEVAADQLLPAAEVLGVQIDKLSPVAAIEAAAQMIFDWTGKMNLPQHLREVGITEADLPGLAQLAFLNHTVHNNPRPVTAASQIESLLRAAW